MRLQQCQKNSCTYLAFISQCRSSFDILNAYVVSNKRKGGGGSKQNTWFSNNDLWKQEWNALLHSVRVFTTSSICTWWTINHDHTAESWTFSINLERVERGLESLEQHGSADTASINTWKHEDYCTTVHMLITHGNVFVFFKLHI